MITIPAADESVLLRLKGTLSAVLAGPSPFYQKRFPGGTAAPDITDFAAWATIPFLLRTDITAVPLWERTFVPRGDVYAIRNTNGTSERKALFTARRTFGDYTAMPKLVGVKRQLSLLTAWYLSEHLRRKGTDSVYINCPYPENETDFRFAARLARTMRADSISGTPMMMTLLAPYLVAEGLEESIKSLEFVGDYCTGPQRALLLRTFHNPFIYQNYSASEWSGIYGVPCERILQERSLAFHIVGDDLFSEFVDREGHPKDIRTGSAELVISSLSPDQPFPLVRYRTGDMLELDLEACTCARGGPRFRMVGRATTDAIRILGGEISTVGIERALSAVYGSGAEFDYEAHFFEEMNSAGLIQSWLELRVQPAPESLVGRQSMAEKLETQIRATLQLTYRQAVEKKLLLPLVVTPLVAPTAMVAGKRLRLFRHS